MQTVTKRELVQRIAEKTGVQQISAKEVIQSFLDEIIQFQNALPAGVAAARAKSTGVDSNKADFDKILGFANRFEFMSTMAYILPVPPAEGSAADTEWLNVGRALQKSFESQTVDAHVMAYAGLGHSYRNNQPEQFNEIVRLQTAVMEARFAERLNRSHVEYRYNHAHRHPKRIDLLRISDISIAAVAVGLNLIPITVLHRQEVARGIKPVGVGGIAVDCFELDQRSAVKIDQITS